MGNSQNKCFHWHFLCVDYKFQIFAEHTACEAGARSLFCSGLTDARLMQQHNGQLSVKIMLGSSVLPRRQWHLFTAVRRCKLNRMTISVNPSFVCPPPPFYFTPRNRISFTARSKAALLKLLTRPRFHYTTTMPVIMCILAGK